MSYFSGFEQKLSYSLKNKLLRGESNSFFPRKYFSENHDFEALQLR